jgi:hypothetical protein
MTARTFLPWVEGPAKQMRESRAEVRRTAEKFLPELWTMPSPLEGWTYKDLLAHLASGEWVFQTMLRDVLGIEKSLPKNATMAYVDEGNAQRLAAHKDSSVEELIAEITTAGETTQELLSKLTDEIDPRMVAWHRPNGDPVTLEQWVQGFPQHDVTHGAQLKTALDNVMM